MAFCLVLFDKWRWMDTDINAVQCSVAAFSECLISSVPILLLETQGEDLNNNGNGTPLFWARSHLLD